jgi:hypothetical protein
VSCEASLARACGDLLVVEAFAFDYEQEPEEFLFHRTARLSLSLSLSIACANFSGLRKNFCFFLFFFVFFFLGPFLRLFCVVVSAHPEGAPEQAFLLAPIPHQCRPYVLSPLLTIYLPFD